MIIIFFFLVLFLYFKLPQNIPNHINFMFQIDGFGSKNVIFLIPFSVAVLGYLLSVTSKRIDLYFSSFNNLIKYFLYYFW
ncbi:DUF1648 domain-containing protein [Liquorilactobacillus capillatus]|uniref:DUF1648 domain-containing protein n=1 Tax=Liquorilactobacillus capillatus TaxID=480931 RepID=UPI003B831DFD